MKMRFFTAMVKIVALAFFFSISQAKAGNIKGTVKVLGNKGIEYVVVYIEKVEGKTFSPPLKNAVVDQARMTFVPHVLPIVAGSTIDFPNSDSTRHNVFSPSKTKKFNLGTYPAGITKHVTFDKTGVVSLLCNVHPEMSAFVLVLQNPYYTSPSKRGMYKISDVPPGKYKLVAWHEKLNPQGKEIEVPDGGEITVDFFLDE